MKILIVRRQLPELLNLLLYVTIRSSLYCIFSTLIQLFITLALNLKYNTEILYCLLHFSIEHFILIIPKQKSMKKQLLFIASLFTAFNLSAQQLDNPGFESWGVNENQNAFLTGHWDSPSICQSPKSCYYFLGTVPGRSGFAARIYAYNNGFKVISSPLLYSGPLASKPSKLTFWYKSTKPLTAGIIITKGEPLNVEELTDATGYGQSIVVPAQSFTKVEIPLIYQREEATDSVGVVFTFGEQELSSSDYFIIDDVELSYEVTGLSDKQMIQMIGSNIVTSSLNLKESVEELIVYNTSGVQVLNAVNTQAADFSSLPEGLYMVTLKKGNSMGTMKVIKQ